jgi:hypothetical protein
VADEPRGRAILRPEDFDGLLDGEPLTYVVNRSGTLIVAPRRSEHVACAGGEDVLGAGELTAIRLQKSARISVVEISNQSTGYCPEPESWPAVAAALDVAKLSHPGRFTFEAIFRRCPRCGARNLVKEEWFVCAECDADLPRAWNFASNEGP